MSKKIDEALHEECYSHEDIIKAKKETAKAIFEDFDKKWVKYYGNDDFSNESIEKINDDIEELKKKWGVGE